MGVKRFYSSWITAYRRVALIDGFEALCRIVIREHAEQARGYPDDVTAGRLLRASGENYVPHKERKMLTPKYGSHCTFKSREFKFTSDDKIEKCLHLRTTNHVLICMAHLSSTWPQVQGSEGRTERVGVAETLLHLKVGIVPWNRAQQIPAKFLLTNHSVRIKRNPVGVRTGYKQKQLSLL
jgi:hypothetical protein